MSNPDTVPPSQSSDGFWGQVPQERAAILSRFCLGKVTLDSDCFLNLKPRLKSKVFGGLCKLY